MNKRSIPICVLLFLAVAAPVANGAEPPGLVGYQGVLRSADGAPLDGSYDMIFRFTDAPVGGTLLLTDLHTGPDAVVVQRGLFTTLLGGGTLAPGTESSLLDIFANHAPVYVEVQVGAETLTPRVQIVSTGFALNAGRFGGRLPDDYLDTSALGQIKQGVIVSNAGLVGNASAGSTGVAGSTISGTAVEGTSTATYGTTYGVHGQSASTSGTGVLGEATAATGNAWGVYGKSESDTGVGVLGSALALEGATEGVRGQASSPDGKGVVGAAFSGSGSAYGVYGESQSTDGVGVYGRATPTAGATTGVGGEAFSTTGTGVAGVAYASSGDAWGVYGGTTSPTGYGVVSDGDSLTAGDIYATGTKYFFAEHPEAADLSIRFACLEGGEIGIYQRGDGRLVNGEARVALPDPFPLIAAGRISVQVTPVEDCAGLYVPEESIGADGFTVRELGLGGSSAAFTYLVMAERAGREGLNPVRPISLSDKILTSRALGPEQKTALRAAAGTVTADRLSRASRSDLFRSLQTGDFETACSLLGGCSISQDSPVDLGLAPSRAAGAPDSSEAAASRAESPAAPAPHTTRERPEKRESVRSIWPAGAPSTLVATHEISAAVEPGDVVVLDPSCAGSIQPGATAFDPGVVGIVAPREGPVPTGERAPVAMAGIVPCKVDASYGPVLAGDLLVVSPTPGHAMRAQDPAVGTLLGKALESLEAGQGTIRVLLTLR